MGFWGSPEWALGGAFAMGILEGIASNAAAKKGMSQLEESSQLMDSAERDGAYIPIQDIQNIGVPRPSWWKGSAKRAGLTSYAHSGEPFILVRTIEEGAICIAWEKVESFLPPPVRQLDDSQLMEQYGITFDGKQYFYGIHRYDQLANAISYAQSGGGKR